MCFSASVWELQSELFHTCGVINDFSELLHCLLFHIHTVRRHPEHSSLIETNAIFTLAYLFSNLNISGCVKSMFNSCFSAGIVSVALVLHTGYLSDDSWLCVCVYFELFWGGQPFGGEAVTSVVSRKQNIIHSIWIFPQYETLWGDFCAKCTWKHLLRVVLIAWLSLSFFPGSGLEIDQDVFFRASLDY